MDGPHHAGGIEPAGAVHHFPSLVGTAKGWYLLLYLVNAEKTEVALFRTDGKADFTRLVTLGITPGLGRERWCMARACKFEGGGLFGAGDYMSLAAAGGRLVAAYVLPRPGEGPVGTAAVQVSVLEEP